MQQVPNLPSTPIDIDALEGELNTHPDQVFAATLVRNLREGFHIGYAGPEFSLEFLNLILAYEHPDIVSAYLDKEIALGLISGPYPIPPFPNFRCNPLGVVPKKTPGKWRSILHLSYPPGESVNDFIDKDTYSLQYVTIERVIHHIRRLGPGCFLSKVDIEAAFRIAPVIILICVFPWVASLAHIILIQLVRLLNLYVVLTTWSKSLNICWMILLLWSQVIHHQLPFRSLNLFFRN